MNRFGPRATLGSLRLRTAALTAVGGLLVLAITTAALVTNQAGDASRVRLTSLYAARSAADELLIGMVNQETGVRGFTLVGDPQFLQPYTDGEAQRIAAVSGLQHLTLSVPERRQLTTTISDMKSWVAWSVARVATLKATTGVRTDTNQSAAGKQLFDTFRTDLALLTTQIDVDLRSATDQASRTAAIVYVIVATTAVASLALFLLLGLMLGRAERRAEQRFQRQQVLRDLSLDALSEASVNAFVQKAVNSVGLASSADGGVIIEVDPATRSPLSMASFGFRSERLTAIPLGSDWEHVLDSGTSLTLSEAIAAGDSTWPDETASTKRSGVTVALKGTAGNRGIISVYSARPREFGGETVALLESAANVISSAIEIRRGGEALLESQNLLEQRVVERTAELKAANDELETFSYSVSHDLRAPLRGIDGFSLALLEDYSNDLPPTAQGYLRRLRQSAQRLGRLIDDMLELSRVSRQPLDLRRVDLSQVAQSVVDELRLADPTRNAIVTINDGLAGWGDTRLIHRVLQNLLGNAWKYTSTREVGHVEFGLTTSRGAPAFFVKDDGVGFDMAYAGKLFSPFQRLHREEDFPGTGVGLATVRRIISRHGREVWIESILNGGTTVFFTLPSQQEDPS
jgi:signal transduction histidine kinase